MTNSAKGLARLIRVAGAVAIAAILLTIAGCRTAPEIPPIAMGDEAVAFSHLSEYIDYQMVQSGTVGVSVAIADRDGLVWSSGFGYADVENQIRVTPATLFDLASISKVFTATAVMQLVEAGKIDLDSPVSDYLPGFAPGSRFTDTTPITVRNLLTHHAGIQPDWLSGMLYTETVQEPDTRFLETPQLLQGAEVCWPPEYVWAYSNLGYALLGAIVDAQGEGSFYDYMDENVLGAVGMRESTFDLRAETYGRISVGYESGNRIPHLVEREVPAGGLVSSADELGLFMASYLDPEDSRLLEVGTRDRMFERQNGHIPRDLDFAQGIGWIIADHGFENLGRVVFHDGGEWSANTRLTLLPDLGLGIAVLTSSAEGGRITGLITKEAIRVMHHLRAGSAPLEYEQPADVAAEPDESLEGYYLYQSLGIVEVIAERGDLWVVSGGLRMKMIPNTEARFRLQPMVLGFIPITIPFLEPIEITFSEVDGVMLSGVLEEGAALPETGVRIEKSVLSNLWYGRQGTYQLINADEGEFPIIAPWKLEIVDGFPTITGALYGSFPFGMVITPQDDDLTLWGGLGRRAGDSIRFEESGADTFIHYQGFVYRKQE